MGFGNAEGHFDETLPIPSVGMANTEVCNFCKRWINKENFHKSHI